MKIETVIKEALEELNSQLDEEIVYDKEMKLIGKNASMDSMTFVTFMTIIEERVEDEMDQDIEIVSDKAFSRENSPFRTIATLEDFIAELLSE